jgi:hypothetical protein
MLGSHGETMRGLLRPGFHSGTVPKLHRKTRHAIESGDRAKVSRFHHELEHAAEGVHRFVERELAPLLAGHNDWGGVPVHVGGVHFGCQRAEIELHAAALSPEPLVLAFENLDGTIEAAIVQRGWADKLNAAQSEILLFALRGLFDMAASAQYDGRERNAETPATPGYASLATPVTWDEWSKKW